MCSYSVAIERGGINNSLVENLHLGRCEQKILYALSFDIDLLLLTWKGAKLKRYNLLGRSCCEINHKIIFRLLCFS